MKDRVKSFRRIKASQLKRNVENWRVHPPSQKSALSTILKDVGFASACLVRDCNNGTFELIDGQLRADLAENEKVPCLILDVTKSEADKILATFDMVTSMADTDQVALDKLISSISTESKELQSLLNTLISHDSELLEMVTSKDESHLLTDSFSILIDCKDESEQIMLLQRLKKEGLTCRAWIL